MKNSSITTKIILLFFSFLLSGCGKEGTDISDNNLKVLSYKELPYAVKTLLDSNITEVIQSNDKQAFSTDKKITFDHYRENIKKKLAQRG